MLDRFVFKWTKPLNSSELVSVFVPFWTMFDDPPVAIRHKQSSEAGLNNGSLHLIFIDDV